MFNAEFEGPDLNIEFHQNPDAIGDLQYRVTYAGEAATVHYIDARKGKPTTITYQGDERDTFRFTDQYTLAENRAANPVGGPQRSVYVTIETQNASGQWTVLAEDIVTGTCVNAPPAFAVQPVAHVDFDKVVIRTTPSLATDFVGCVVHKGSSASFTPDDTNLVAEGAGPDFVVPIAENEVAYFRVAPLDTFGRAGLNYCPAIGPVSRLSFNVAVEQTQAVSAITSRLDNDISDALVLLDERANDADAAIAAVPGQISSATSALNTQIEAINGQITLTNPAAGTLGKRFLDTEAETDTALTRISGMESVVGTTATAPGSLRARMTSAETVITNLPNDYASASRASALEASVNTAGTGLLARTGALETTTANLATGKADATRVSVLEAQASALNARTANGNFDSSLDGWAYNYSGTPTQTGMNVVWASSLGGRTGVAKWGGESTTALGRLFSVRKFPVDPTRKYRIRVSTYVGAGTGVVKFYAGFRALGADGQPTHSNNQYAALGGGTRAAGTGWVDTTSPIITGTGTSATAFPTGTTTISLMGYLNYDGNTGVADIGMGDLYLEDVTDAESTASVAARATTLETATANLQTGKADVTALNTLSSEVTTARGTSSSLNARLNQVETDVAGRAASSRVSLLEATVNVGRNLLVNPVPVNGMANWSAVSGSWTTYQPAGGPGHFYSNTNTANRYIRSDNIPVSAGSNYTLQYERYATGFTGGTMLGEVYWFDASGTYISTTGNGNVSIGTQHAQSTWVYGSSVHSAPAGAAFAAVQVGIYGSTNSGGYTEVGARRLKFEYGGAPTLWTDDAETMRLNTRITSAETVITNLPTNYASASSVSSLTSEITSARNGSANLNAQLTDMRSTVTNGLAGKVDTSLFTALSGEVTTARGGQSSLNTRLSNIQVAVDGKASASDFTALLARTNSGQFTDGNQHFLDGLNGWNSAGIASLTVGTVGGRPNVLTSSSTNGADVYSSYRFPFDTTRKYKIKTSLWAGSGGSGVRFYVGFRAYDINGAALTHNPGSYAYVTLTGSILSPGSGWQDFSSAVIGPQVNGSIYGYPPGTAFIELLVLCNYGGGATPWGVDYVTLHDVTDAEANATNTASITSLSNTVTTNNTALASRASRIEASSDQSVLANSSFMDFPSATGFPASWVDWSNGSGTRVTNPQNGAYAYQVSASAGNTQVGLLQNSAPASVLPNSWWVMRMRARLDAGTLRGAGLLCYVFDASTNVVNTATVCPFYTPINDGIGSTLVGNGVVGRIYEWTQLFQVTHPSASSLRLYAMTHWTGWSNSTANDVSGASQLTWLNASIRPATTEEVAVGRANTGAGLNSRISTVETATTDGRFASASTVTSLSSTVGDHTSSISSLLSTTASLEGRVEGTAGLTVQAGNRVAGMRFHAVDNSDTNYSSIDFLADTLRVWSPDQSLGIPPFEVRNGGVRMKSAFVDRLSVGTSITLGSGIQWKVAVQPIDINVTDGQVVSFGYDLGNNPSLSFFGNNLAPLSSGETYKLYADNLTPTGFTARLKIETPATPSNIAVGPLGSTPNGPCSHHAYLDSYGGRTNTGNYAVRVTGTNRVYKSRFGGGDPYYPEEPYDDPGQTVDGDTWITVYGYNGGSWVELDTIYITPNFAVGTGYEDQAFDVTQSVSASSNISHIGVAVTYKTFTQSNVATLRLNWQAQGTGAGIRSATPNGQVSAVTVRPKT